ncbi:MAG: peptidoglycan DD-metalloendopeptidase family protein [Woeseia sp.]|nr:peptidoglycan DD-metalloendopeptidase family protein [Woeseia sp.]
MTIRVSLVLTLSLCFAEAGSAPEHSPWPGGIAVVPVEGVTRPLVTVNGKPALVIREDTAWVAVIGIPLDHDESTTLTASIERAGAASQSIEVKLEAANYRVQRLNVDRKYVEPDPAALERIFAERKVIDRALTHWHDTPITAVVLQQPVPGARSTSFGSQRIFNDQPRSPHKGMDITASSGTPILTPLAGEVAAVGDYYFNGNTVILDHGQGLISLYCHLSAIDVTPGQAVAAGTLLGKVGATGRVTGAHLHFATYLNGTAVDPSLLLLP